MFKPIYTMDHPDLTLSNFLGNSIDTQRASSQAKGIKSTSFHTCVRNEVDLVPLACEDAQRVKVCLPLKVVITSCNCHIWSPACLFHGCISIAFWCCSAVTATHFRKQLFKYFPFLCQRIHNFGIPSVIPTNTHCHYIYAK